MKLKLTENKLKQIVAESVKKVLREYRDIDDDNYYGGGLPDKYFDDDYAPDTSRITKKELKQLDSISKTIADIANNTSDETDLLFQAVECLDGFISKYKQ